MGGNGEKRRKETVGSENLENSKERGREAQGTQGLKKNYTSRERESPLSRQIRDFRYKDH